MSKIRDIIDNQDGIEFMADNAISAIQQLVEVGEFTLQIDDDEATFVLIDTAIFVNRNDELLAVVTYFEGESRGYVTPDFQAVDETTYYCVDLASAMYPWVIRIMQLAYESGVTTVADKDVAIYNDVAAGNRLWLVLNAAFTEFNGWMPERYRDVDPDEILHRRLLTELEKHTTGFDPESAEQNISSYHKTGSAPVSLSDSERHTSSQN